MCRSSLQGRICPRWALTPAIRTHCLHRQDRRRDSLCTSRVKRKLSEEIGRRPTHSLSLGFTVLLVQTYPCYSSRMSLPTAMTLGTKLKPIPWHTKLWTRRRLGWIESLLRRVLQLLCRFLTRPADHTSSSRWNTQIWSSLKNPFTTRLVS